MLKLKLAITISIILSQITSINAQSLSSKIYYVNALEKITFMLNGTEQDFSKTVFIAENAYYDEMLSDEAFNKTIKFYSSLCREIINSGSIEYSEKDKDIASAQCAVFVFMTDSIPMLTNEGIIMHSPFSYNHDDFAGQKDWSNMFVSTLMETNKGNCHSMPYLYKMIMDELGYKSHLALAPNHIYIKVQNKRVGWYNIELTCADFPTDAWLMASGYIHLDAIRNGIYMKALNEKESVALTLVDLAQGYQAKFGIQDGSFMLQCRNTALEHFPTYINALLLKAEALTELYRQSPSEERMAAMNDLYTTIHELGYRKTPNDMYMKWLGSLNEDTSDKRMKAVVRK